MGTSSGGKRRPKAPAIRPGFVVVAVVCVAAALTEPADFNAAAALIWVLGTVTAGLLTCAAMAVLQPIIKLCHAQMFPVRPMAPDEMEPS